MPFKNRLYILLFLGLILISPNLHSQGCSDAGFCTMGALSPEQDFKKDRNIKIRSLELGFYEGQTTITPSVRAGMVNASFSLKKLIFQTKFLVQGNYGGNFGDVPLRLGDISLSISKILIYNYKFSINGTAGFKISTGNGNLKDEHGRSLPMYYQANLGSHDFVLGGSFLTRKWLISTGLQIPIIHFNNNQFDYSEWQDYPSESYLRLYPEATNLKRGADAMARIERDFRFSKISFNIGFLAIYRFTKDRVLSSETNDYLKMEGTIGFATTLLFGFHYRINTRNTIKLGYGDQIRDRIKNPDGLSRKHVITVSYQIKF